MEITKRFIRRLIVITAVWIVTVLTMGLVDESFPPLSNTLWFVHLLVVAPFARLTTNPYALAAGGLLFWNTVIFGVTLLTESVSASIRNPKSA